MTALVGYVAKDVARSLRWVAPILTFLVALAIFAANTGALLPTYASSATVLFFVASWLTIVVVNNEDPIQQDVTSVTAGGWERLRLAKLSTAYLFVVLLAGVALVGPPLVSASGTTWRDVIAGAGCHLLSGLAGVSAGALLSRPIVRRTAWAVLIVVLVGFADIAVPDAPPIRQLLVILNKQPPFAIAMPMAAVAAETIAIAILAVAASLRLAHHRN